MVARKSSEPSLLNLNESDFDFDGDSNGIIEREDSFLQNELSKKQSELSPSIGSSSEINCRSPRCLIGLNDKASFSAIQEKYYHENEFDQIDEENENSSSANLNSNDENKLSIKKKSSINSQSIEEDEVNKHSSDNEEDVECQEVETPLFTFANSAGLDRSLDADDLLFSRINSKASGEHEQTSMQPNGKFEQSGQTDNFSGYKEFDVKLLYPKLDPAHVAYLQSERRYKVKSCDNSFRASQTIREYDRLCGVPSKMSSISGIDSNFEISDCDSKLNGYSSRKDLLLKSKKTFEQALRGCTETDVTNAHNVSHKSRPYMKCAADSSKMQNYMGRSSTLTESNMNR